jgi:hypothetical protein
VNIFLLLCSRLGASIELNLSSQGDTSSIFKANDCCSNIYLKNSIRSVAGTLAYDMMSIYTGNLSCQIWESGAMWGFMIISKGRSQIDYPCLNFAIILSIKLAFLLNT